MIFQQIVTWFQKLSPDLIMKGVRIAITIVLGLFAVRLLANLSQRYILKKATPQRQMLVRKIITFSGVFLVFLAVLAELGVKLTAVLGAAGVVGIAVGFAAQTSVSNIISGIFLISEKPFAIGDAIKVGDTSGVIMSIDLLSIKIRTFDNLFVRFPNEKILNSLVTNITRFPIRRMDITFEVAYGQDLKRLQSLLMDIASANPWSLDEPEPIVVFSAFKESGIEVLVGLWFTQDDYLNLRNSIMIDITSRFDATGIRFAVPGRAVQMVEKAGSI